MNSRSHRALLRNVTHLVTGVALVGFCGMLLSTWAQILFRKLAISVDWTEELARILFITSVFLGIAIGVAEKRHIVVDFLLNRLPPRLRALVGMLFNAVILVFLIFLLRGAAAMVSVTWESYMIAISWLRTGYLYFIECVAIVLTILYVLYGFVESFKAFLSGAGDMEKDGE